MKTYSDPTYQRTTAASRRAARSVRYLRGSTSGFPYVIGATRAKVNVWIAKQATKKARRAAKLS